MQVMFGGEVGVKEIPEFRLGEGNPFAFSIVNLLGQEVRVVVELDLGDKIQNVLQAVLLMRKDLSVCT
jgi:hypothetical protein